MCLHTHAGAYTRPRRNSLSDSRLHEHENVSTNRIYNKRLHRRSVLIILSYNIIINIIQYSEFNRLTATIRTTQSIPTNIRTEKTINTFYFARSYNLFIEIKYTINHYCQLQFIKLNTCRPTHCVNVRYAVVCCTLSSLSWT